MSSHTAPIGVNNRHDDVMLCRGKVARGNAVKVPDRTTDVGNG